MQRNMVIKNLKEVKGFSGQQREYPRQRVPVLLLGEM